MQWSLVYPVVPIPNLRVSHLPYQDLDFHMREVANVVFSEVPWLLHSDPELYLKCGPPPSSCCTGGLQTFTPYFILVISLSFSLFYASVSTQNQPTPPLSF